MPKFHQEMCKIKDIFIKVVTVKGVLTDMLEQFLKLFIPEGIIHSAEKKQVDNFLPYMDVISTKNKVKLYKTFKQLLPACDLRVMFNISSRMKNYFNFKDKINQELCSLYNLT